MRYEVESEAVAEGFHLGHRNHLPPRTPQYHHVRVVDHHPLRRARHVTQRIGEEHLAVESLKGGLDLEEQQARVTQHRRGGLRFVLLAAHLDFMRRGIVLHLHSRLKRILTGRCDRRLPDALPATECCQRWIGQQRATRR